MAVQVADSGTALNQFGELDRLLAATHREVQLSVALAAQLLAELVDDLDA